MAEYIDREKIISKTCSNCTMQIDLACQYEKPCEYLIAAFLNEDPDDVAPVVRGRWIFNDDWWEFRCTNCRNSIGNIEKYKYCPHCGARMD